MLFHSSLVHYCSKNVLYLACGENNLAVWDNAVVCHITEWIVIDVGNEGHSQKRKIELEKFYHKDTQTNYEK